MISEHADSGDLDRESFVRAVFDGVYLAAIRDVRSILRKPPGRKPSPELVKLSQWYNSLGEDNQGCVDRVIADVADGAVFHFLAILDGVKPITDGNEETVEIAIRSDLREIRFLTPGDGNDLHDIFRRMVDGEDQYTSLGDA
jgi:hypothetical protein